MIQRTAFYFDRRSRTGFAPSCASSIFNFRGHHYQKRNHRPPMSFQPVPLLIRAPLLCLTTCAAVTGLSHPQIIERIEDGSLSMAFDLSAEQSTERLVRVSAKALAHFVSFGRGLRTETPATLLAEINDLLPTVHPAEAKPQIDMPNMRRILAISTPHILRLA